MPGSPDDICVISALRTPICKAKRGAFKETTPDDLLHSVLRATIDSTGVPPAAIGGANDCGETLPIKPSRHCACVCLHPFRVTFALTNVVHRIASHAQISWLATFSNRAHMLARQR